MSSSGVEWREHRARHITVITLITITITTGFAGFTLTGEATLDATYQTVVLFFNPLTDLPKDHQWGWLLGVARFAALATTLSVIVAAYLAITGTSVRTWWRRHITHRTLTGHILIITDHPVPLTSSTNTRHTHDTTIVTIGCGQHNKTTTTSSMQDLPRTAMKERAAHADYIIIALNSSADTLRTATHLRTLIAPDTRTTRNNHHHERTNTAPLILLHTTHPNDVLAIRSSNLNNQPLGPYIDAYHAGDLYAEALNRHMQTGTDTIPALLIHADAGITERMHHTLTITQPHLPVLTLPSTVTHHGLTDTVHSRLEQKLAHEHPDGAQVCVVWDTPDDFPHVLTTAARHHTRTPWCITSPTNTHTAEALGYTAIPINLHDTTLITTVSELDTLAKIAHTTWAPHTPWENTSSEDKNSSRRQVALLRYHLTHQAGPHTFTPDVHAVREHDSWHEQKTATGWTYGPHKDPTRKLNPYLLPWIDLSQERKTEEIHAIQALLEAFTKHLPHTPHPTIRT